MVEASASLAGDRMYVKFQQMWCIPVDYSRCEVRQRRRLEWRPWTAWQVEYEDGSSRRNAECADLADQRRRWAVQGNVAPVHSEPCKPGSRFYTQYVPGHEASVMIPERRRCGLSGEADGSVVLTHSGRTVSCASSRLEGLPERCRSRVCWAPDWPRVSAEWMEAPSDGSVEAVSRHADVRH